MSTTNIQVTNVDNELYILASQGSGSSELIHVKEGYGSPIDTSIVPQYILASGSYTLTMIGINWGGGTAFSVAVTTDGTTTVYPTTPVGTDIGVVWTQSIPMTV
jgi:hypothetical protein